MICCRPCCAIISTFDVSGFFSSAARTRAAEFFVYWWMWVGGGVSPSNVLEVGPRRAALGRDWSPGLFAEKASYWPAFMLLLRPEKFLGDVRAALGILGVPVRADLLGMIPA